MVNPNPGFLSKRVKRREPLGITSDRYEFLGLDQAEPDLGDPLVGPSSIGVNPYTGNISDLYILVSDNTGSGNRYWTKQTNVISGGLVTPGSVTIRNEGDIVGSVSQITDINFIGSGVTVSNPASWIGAGSSSVDVSVTVTDALASGDVTQVQYHGSDGLIKGSTGFVYTPSNQRVGIGSTLPTEKLDVLGNAKISGVANIGIVTATEGYFDSKLSVGNFEISDDTTFVKITSGKVGIGTLTPSTTLDVVGNAKISGIATINSIDVNQITLQNINNLGITTSNGYTINGVYIVDSSRQLRNIASLDAITKNTIESAIALAPNDFTSLNVTGISTLTVLEVTGQSTQTNQNITGISTVNNQNVTGVSTISTLIVDDLSSTYSSSTNSQVTGIATVGVLSATTATISSIKSSFVGIGTSNPTKPLDVIGDISLTGTIYVSNGSGTPGQVLISQGSDPIQWGSPSDVVAGAATSITVFETSDNTTYYPLFVDSVSGITTVNADSNNLFYNPSTVTLGIGTNGTGYNLNVQGTSNLNGNVSVGGSLTELHNGQYWNVVTQSDVGYGASQVPLNQYLGQLAFVDSYLPPQFRNTEVTTTSTSSVILDSLPTIQIRSAKYNIQVTCNGQLVGSGTSSSSASVTDLSGGTKYVHGSYTNISLSTQEGSGNDARANINVNREYLLTIDSIVDGVFNTETSTTGVTSGTPVIFNRLIPTSDAENSRVTSINVNNPGTGYTTVPTITIDDPTNNPAIPGVTGIGSTATATVRSMELNNIYVFSGVTTSVGVGTIGIPTITFRGAFSGAGTTATGRLGFGVSTITISDPGYGITEIPTITYSGGRTTSPSAGITSVFVTNIYMTNTGYGYSITNYPTISFPPPTSGVSAAATVTSLGLSNYYEIVSSGIGYTVPPILTVDSPAVGINTGLVATTLGIVTFSVVSPGSGYTVAPTLTISPNPTNFSSRVGMGITITNSQLYGGSGYSNTPVFNVVPAGGIGTGAQIGLVSKDADTGEITEVEIVNPGFGYTVPPTINITDSTGVGAALTITELFLSDVSVFNVGYGLTQIPNTNLISQQTIGSGADVDPILGIGSIFTVGFGSGYHVNPSIAVTAFDGVTGSGGAVALLGLGVTSQFIEITNPGIGYTFIPPVTFSQPIGVGTSAIGVTGAGATAITVSTTGIGFSNSVPIIGFNYGSPDFFGSGIGASVTSIRITNGYIDVIGTGYTSTDLTTSGISSIGIPGIGVTVGFGVSSVELVNLGIGYTVVPTVTIDPPTIGFSTAQLSANLGYPGILPGVAFTTGTSEIYYVNSVPTSNSITLSTGVGFGTLTRTDVADNAFLANKPSAYVGGSIDSVQIVSPGSGYTSRSIVGATNFDGANVGTGFTFVAAPVDNYQISDIMILQSSGSFSPTCDIIEYATLANNEILGSFSASLNTVGSDTFGNLNFTPTYGDNTIKISRNKIDI